MTPSKPRARDSVWRAQVGYGHVAVFGVEHRFRATFLMIPHRNHRDLVGDCDRDAGAILPLLGWKTRWAPSLPPVLRLQPLVCERRKPI